MKKNLFMSAGCVLLFCLFGCKPVVEVSEHIDTLTTWESTNVYVITRWINVNAPLTIEPGTIIKFKSGTYINVKSTLLADGTEEEPIVFTSYRDDAHGGDTNEDGAFTTPGPGDWAFLYVEGDRNESVFNQCRFYYGGKGGWQGYTLGIASDETTVTNCVFAYNKGDKGNNMDNGDCALNARFAGSSTVITNNTFYANEKPLRIGPAVDIDASNRFHHPDNASLTNDYNAIFVSTYDDISGQRSWAETEVPFVVEPWSMEIPSGSSLTLADNVIVKFRSNSLRVVDDNLINYDGSGVWFTSWKDDTLGGDANGDGALTSPADGDWTGIYLGPTGTTAADWENIFYDNY